MERCASRSLARFRASCSGVNDATLRVPAREAILQLEMCHVQHTNEVVGTAYRASGCVHTSPFCPRFAAGGLGNIFRLVIVVKSRMVGHAKVWMLTALYVSIGLE